jgi:AcrR family transcriptional regulator
VSSPAPSLRRSRAAALSPEDRRAAIIEAAVPLVIAHGTGVTTRQIAESACVAEGTIFRVFADKQAVIDAAIEAVLDPAREIAAVEAIPRDLPLEERLAAAVAQIQRRVDVIWRLMAAVDLAEALARRRREHRVDTPELRTLADLIAPDAARLRVEPLKAAQMLRSLTFATSHPAFVGDDPAPPGEVVSLLLDGIRSR